MKRMLAFRLSFRLSRSKRWWRALAVTGAILGLPTGRPVTSAAEQDPASWFRGEEGRLWYAVAEDTLAASVAMQRIVSGKYRIVGLDHSVLIGLLARAPLEWSAAAREANVVMILPWPDGSIRRFRIEESPIMEPDLAAQFPELKTYQGQGIDDLTASVRFDWTPSGFHAIVLSAEGTVFIDPYSSDDTYNYVVYYARDYVRVGGEAFRCEVLGVETPALKEEERNVIPLQPAHGTTLRTYRLAVAATGEYTASYGGTVAGAMNGIVTTINRVNGIYERDVAVRMNLVGNNASVVYTDPFADPYTNGDAIAMSCQNASTLDTTIEPGNYDIGHVFGTVGGGAALPGVVCNNANGCGTPSGSNKGRGVSAIADPRNDPFDVNYVAHEMGHQFGAEHTFNGTTGPCASAQGGRNASTAFEPGSGSTIMTYAGQCGSEALQPNNDAYFHAGSQDQIIAFINNPATGGSCAAASSTGNTPPTVNAGPDYTIPHGTPFTLTSMGSDTDGDYLNYTWEEMDIGAQAPPNTDDGSRPIFRSFLPAASPSRTFPRLSDILNDTATIGESRPMTTRSMNFRVTARDNRPVGGTASDDMVLNVRIDSGPFLVTGPGAVIWPAGSKQTVTWNVASTTAAPVNCTSVKISLSTDGGNTFPIVLAASTPNDGSEEITVPNYPTTSARIKVEAVGNVFFDISHANFTINTPATSLSINDVIVSEGNAGTTSAHFTVTLSTTSASIVTVAYATANGTAMAGSDYVSTGGTLTFAAGESTKTATVIINGDATSEPDETFLVNLSGATNATIADGQGIGTITNDESGALTPGIADGTFEAGVPWPAWTVQTSTNFGTPLCNAASCPGLPPFAGSNWAWFGGVNAVETATLGQTVVLPPSSSLMLRFQMRIATTPSSPESLVVSVDGTTVQTFTTPTSAESAYSLREIDVTSFADGGSHALLFAYSNTSPLSDYANILVDNVELFSYPSSLSIDDVAMIEGNSGTTTARFTVTLLPTRASTVTVAYATADGTATAGSDYVSTSGTLTFPPGQSTQTVDVFVNGDTTSEPNETFFVNLLAATNATITDGQGVGAVMNDECTVSTTAVADGTFEAGSPWPAWTVQTSINFGTPLCDIGLCGTGSPPFAGANWAWFGGATSVEASTLGQAVILPVSRSITLRFQMRVEVTAPSTDTLVISVDGTPVRTLAEPTATEFGYSLRQVDLTPFGDGGSHALLFSYNGPTTGAANFLVDNVELFACPLELPSLSINDVMVPEGNSGTTIARFTATLSAPSAQPVTVAYGMGSGTATAGSDYMSASGTLTFPPGTTTQEIAVTVNGDTLDEPNETFFVNLSSPTNATMSDDQGVGTIHDDDATPSLSIDDVRLREGWIPKIASFTVTLSAASGQVVTVRFEGADGTATQSVDGGDYSVDAKTLTFAPGVTSQTIDVTVWPNGSGEVTEVFFVNLSSPTNATISDGQGVGTIDECIGAACSL